MCGIAGFHRRGDALVPNVGRLADTLLLAIAERGPDATGTLAMLPDGKVQLDRKTINASKFVARRRKHWNDDLRSMLLHTRFATVGRSDDVRNAHPVVSGHTAVIHNGTIYNHRKLSEALSLPRRAEVDSEVIAALVEYAGWDHVGEALDLLQGGAAVAIVNAKHPDELILARTEGYPLVMYVTDELVVWASTRWAIERAWAQTFGEPPDDGEFMHLPEWTMVRVNGDVTVTAIRKPKPKRRRSYSLQPNPPKKAKKSTAKKGGKAKPVPVPKQQAPLPAFLEREPWMEETVRDYQRSGLSYADAFDAVYGVSPDGYDIDFDDIDFDDLLDDSSGGSSWR